MFRFRTVTWSPVEETYLKSHKDEPIQQLSIALAKSNNAVKKKLYELKHGKPAPGTKKSGKRTKIGKRKDLNLFVRSGWEANVARWIKHQGKTYKYEPEVFVFKGIKHGTVSYCPDFYIVEDDTWIEVKGQLMAKDRTRINRFKKLYPAEFKKLKAIVGRPSTAAAKFFQKLEVPILAYYADLDKEFSTVVKSWE